MPGILTKGSDVLFKGRLFGGIKCNDNGRISVPYNANYLSFTNGLSDSPFSISIIIRVFDGNNYFLIKGINSGEVELFVALDNTPSLKSLRVSLSNSSPNSNFIRKIFTLSKQEVNQLSHYIITYDGSKTLNGISLYRNKLEKTVFSSVTNGSYTGQQDNYQNILIGNTDYVFGSLGNYMMSTYKLFNSVLSEEDRNKLFDTENFAMVANNNCLINYDFREKQGTMLNDRSGNGLHGTLSTLNSDFFWCNPYTEVAI